MQLCKASVWSDYAPPRVFFFPILPLSFRDPTMGEELMNSGSYADESAVNSRHIATNKDCTVHTRGQQKTSDKETERERERQIG